MNVGNRKNILLIVFDFMGYCDIEPFGNSEIKTPNILRLSEQGARYTDCYAASPVCGPSRASLMTGCYPRHLGFETNIEIGGCGLPPGQKTLPRYLHDAGYRTAIYGKWHLENNEDTSPNSQGFDDYLGFNEWNIGYYSHKTDAGEHGLFQNAKKIIKAGYTTDIFADAAAEFITRDAGTQPFFVYLSFNSMLPPYTPPAQGAPSTDEDFSSTGSRPGYVTAIEHLDQAVGRVLDALEQSGQAKNTAVFLTFDHGGGHLATPGPFFNGFATLWEGGIRVPLIFRLDGVVPSGSKVTTPTILMDVSATIFALADVATETPIDGEDLLSGAAERPDRPLYWRIDVPHDCEEHPRCQSAVREGAWKYLNDGVEFLFDLKADPGERVNLAGAHPDVLNRLREMSESEW